MGSVPGGPDEEEVVAFSFFLFKKIFKIHLRQSEWGRRAKAESLKQTPGSAGNVMWGSIP